MNNTNKKLVYWGSTLFLFLGSCSTTELIEDDSLSTEIVANSTSNLKADDFLDYGVYWFDANNTPYKGYDEINNVPIEVPKELYDDTKPTVIHFHGWSLGSSADGYNRTTFEFIDDDNGIDVNTVKAWKDKGWNVAIFYWNQFADELEVKNAEAKIWSAQNGQKGMRYRLSDGSYSTEQSPKVSLNELAFNQLQDLLADNTSKNIRLSGNSIGNQIAVGVAKLMSDAVANGSLSNGLVPNRIELLDPFWSQDSKSYLGDMNNDGKNDWTGERVRWYIDQMKKRDNVAVTWYKSSLILNTGIGDGNNDLKEEVAFQSVRLWYLSVIDIVAKHSYISRNYFWSMAFDAPEEVTLNFWKQRETTGKAAASASTPNARILDLMDSGSLWDQVEGRYTPTHTDDQFELKDW